MMGREGRRIGCASAAKDVTAPPYHPARQLTNGRTRASRSGAGGIRRHGQDHEAGRPGWPSTRSNARRTAPSRASPTVPAGPATSSPSPPRSTPPTRTAAPRPAGTARGEQPRTAPNWIRDSHSSRLLAGLAATGRPLPHDDLDDLARAGDRGDAQTVDYPRGVLVATRPCPNATSYRPGSSAT